MGFWDGVLNWASGTLFSPNTEVYDPFDPDSLSETLLSSVNHVLNASPAQLYREQPALRTVTSFLGRNVGQLSIHTFRAVGENDRVRVRNSATARALKIPNPTMTSYQLKFAMTVDKALYDWAFLLPVTAADGTRQLWRIPPAWVTPVPQGPFKAPKYRIRAHHNAGGSVLPGNGESMEIDEDKLIVFKGYDPTSTTKGSSPVQTLKALLAEQAYASQHRMNSWKRGGRVSSVLERPKDAPPWTDEQAKRFSEDWYSNWVGSGPKAGGTPILEDGMTLRRVDLSAQDQQWAEGMKLAMAQVAGAYHISPTMVGSMEGATFNNVREYRKMLFGDTLAPMLVEFEDVLNQFLLPRYGEQDLYAEFNIWAKLAGSFEEQAQFLQAAVGAPYMLRNEARARLNLPAVDGGDELVTPLNVLIGNQASPQDSDPTTDPDADLAGEVEAKTAELDKPKIEIKATLADRDYVVKYNSHLKTFYERQARVVQSKLGTKAGAEWWDEARWNRELQAELLKVHLTITSDAAQEQLKAAGIDPADYDPTRTVVFLTERARRDAENINGHTFEGIKETLEDPDGDVSGFFVALVASAAVTAQSMATSSLNWGKLESGRQTRAGSKTWVVTSKHPRDSHRSINGQTVPIESKFSNGLDWPGDPGGSADETAGCTCQINVVY